MSRSYSSWPSFLIEWFMCDAVWNIFQLEFESRNLLNITKQNLNLNFSFQRAPSWRTHGPSGSGSRSPCCGTTWPWPVMRSAPRRRSTRWRSRGSAWRSRSTDSSTMRGGTSRRHKPAVSAAEKTQMWFSLIYFTLRDYFGSEDRKHS